MNGSPIKALLLEEQIHVDYYNNSISDKSYNTNNTNKEIKMFQEFSPQKEN